MRTIYSDDWKKCCGRALPLMLLLLSACGQFEADKAEDGRAAAAAVSPMTKNTNNNINKIIAKSCKQ